MLFIYEAVDASGRPSKGTVDAINLDVAVNSLQRRGFIISTIKEEGKGMFDKGFNFFERVKVKDVVLLSRQMSTLFEAQVSALRIFRLLAAETTSAALGRHLNEVADDLQGGSSISKALSKHPKLFSDFYVNMVKAGEEAGKLDQTFVFLADHLERSYEITSKARSALIYPSFVITTFIGVMVLMLTTVIPKLSAILTESGQEIPIYTKIVLGLSGFFVHYGLFVLVGAIVAGFFYVKWSKTKEGSAAVAQIKLHVPYLGTLYTKLYLSRFSDNMSTMLASAIPIVKALEITGSVVGNPIYEAVIKDAVEQVKGGSPLSDALSKHPEMPGIVVQMVRVGEETGELSTILKTLSRFYQREVSNAVEALVSLIEPAMIIALGLGVGFLLTSVLLPIYNISGGI